MKRWIWILLPGLAALLAACGSQALHGEDEIALGDTLYSQDFSDASGFETGDYPAQGASLSIEAGRYQVRQQAEFAQYIWGQGGEAAQDLNITVEATPQTRFEDDLYGVMCRVDETGTGYGFLVSSNGFAAIVYADGRSLSFIQDWHEHDAIRHGTAQNSLRAVCIGDYLALYVNGDFVMDAEDDRHIQAGQVGLLGGVLTFDEPAEMVVSFDNLSVTEASLR
ncbi:MAG: hypothetical protein HC915_09390 [Anaerolineae bacterium]|nr:hypothetical protein [Anaerolineae bacterium]